MQIVTDTGMDMVLPPDQMPEIEIHLIRHAITLDGKTRGIPRAINNICDMALVYGYAEEVKPVNCELIMEMIRSRPIIRRQAENTPRGDIDQRLRDLVLEIKGIDLAAV